MDASKSMGMHVRFSREILANDSLTQSIQLCVCVCVYLCVFACVGVGEKWKEKDNKKGYSRKVTTF